VSIDKSALPRLSWSFRPAEPVPDECPALQGGDRASGDVGVLRVIGSVDGVSQPLCWLKPRDREGALRLWHEAHIARTFHDWLQREWPLAFWDLLTAWTLYERWLVYGVPGEWRDFRNRAGTGDPLLDGMLQPSRGWLLWPFQWDALLAVVASDVERQRARLFAHLWLDRSEISARSAALRPSAICRDEMLRTRACLRADGSLILHEPNIAVVTRLHRLFSDASDQGGA